MNRRLWKVMVTWQCVSCSSDDFSSLASRGCLSLLWALASWLTSPWQTTWLDQLHQITALCCFSSSSFSFSSSFFLSPSSSNVAKSSVGSKQELTWSDVSVHIRFIASGVFFIYIFFILFYYLSLFFFYLFFLCYLLIFAVFGQTVPVNSWHRKSRSHGNGFTACPHPWCQHWGHYAVGIMYAGLHGKWGPFLFSQRLCVCVCVRGMWSCYPHFIWLPVRVTPWHVSLLFFFFLLVPELKEEKSAEIT